MIVNDDVITMMMMMTDDEYRYLEHEHEVMEVIERRPVDSRM